MWGNELSFEKIEVLEKEDMQRQTYPRRSHAQRNNVSRPRTARSQAANHRAKCRKKRRRGNSTIAVLILLTMLLVVMYGIVTTLASFGQEETFTGEADFQVRRVGDFEKISMEAYIVNVALFGTDEEGIHTDVNMVVSYNTKTNDLSVISVPRDTKVVMNREMTSYLNQNGRTVPEREGVYGECKLTEVHAYAGTEKENEFSVMALEDLLGIEMDYYVEVNLSAFRRIVDELGGIEMYVPQDMDYEDPEQDLYIHLDEGWQVLDGDKAEQLVRFRKGYAQQDLQRIQTQQAFLEAFLQKICKISSLSSVIRIALEETETNITFTDAMQYVKYLPNLDLENIKMGTIPGEGGVFFVADEAGVAAMVQEYVYGEEPEETTDSTNTESMNSAN